MRDFSWKYFAMTGDVDAYLLYRESSAGAEFAETAPEKEDVQHEENE